MAKISFDELEKMFITERTDHPGRKGLFGRRRTRQTPRFRQKRFEARQAWKSATGMKF